MSEGMHASNRWTRRDFLKLAGTGAASAALGGGVLALPRSVLAGPRTINLNFSVWSYSVDTIQENIKRFEQAYNNRIKVRVTDFPWPQYRDTMIARFSGRSALHVLYNGGDWLPEFARAGWVVPLEDYLPAVRTKYAKKIAGFAVQDMTYNGKIYGLPYYADMTTFQYNDVLLKANGLKAPATWEELADQARFLQGKGIASPIIFEFATNLPNTIDNFTAMVYGRGGDWFDANLDPVFDRPNSEFRQQLAWVAGAVKQRTAVVLPHETDVVKALNTGKHVYAVLWNYNLAEANNKAVSPRAGQFKIALMPGRTHETQGMCKFYNMTKYAVDQGKDTIDASIKFIEYFGGEHQGQYKIAKRWAVEKGLGFGQLPLYNDAEVRKSFGQWIDFDTLKLQAGKARARRHPVWEGVFNEFARVQLVRAISGETSVDSAVGAMASKAKELKAQFK